MRSAKGKLKTPSGTPNPKIKHIDSRLVAQDGAPDRTTAHLVAHHEGVLAAVKPSILAHLGRVVGRKQIAHDLGVSDSMLDQMIAGQKNDPVVRIKRLVCVAVKYLGSEPALEIARDLVAEVSGKVLTAEQVEGLRKAAEAVK